MLLIYDKDGRIVAPYCRGVGRGDFPPPSALVKSIAEAIREGEKATGEHIPIVAMTAHTLKGDEERCLAVGMDAYLAKPIPTPELLAVLDEMRATWL
jgi:response regulator RpfG family c-di-GMP phosphodiesterase